MIVGVLGMATDLSCPTVSPEPSSLLQPASVEESWASQSWSSLALMLTMSLNSLGGVVSIVIRILILGFERLYSMTVSLSLTMLTLLSVLLPSCVVGF